MTKPIITLENVTRTFMVKRQQIKAVDDVSLEMYEGEIMCLVGESGCGKTTTGKMIVGLLPPSSGQIAYLGRNLKQLDKDEHKKYRLGVQLIHQDPYASLNPSQMVYQILSTPLLRHGLTKGETTRANAYVT